MSLYRHLSIKSSPGSSHANKSMGVSSIQSPRSAHWRIGATENGSAGNGQRQISLHVRRQTVGFSLDPTQTFLRHAIELRSEFFHCCIFADNFTSLSTVQSYLCGN